MAAGCPERFDWEFIRWILWDGRTKTARERYQNIHSTYPEKFISLKNQKELDRFLDKVKNDLLEIEVNTRSSRSFSYFFSFEEQGKT